MMRWDMPIPRTLAIRVGTPSSRTGCGGGERKDGARPRWPLRRGWLLLHPASWRTAGRKPSEAARTEAEGPQDHHAARRGEAGSVRGCVARVRGRSLLEVKTALPPSTLT
jgi:hypothetical protein